MIRRRVRPQFHEPSLVPMADMLTNTVGVVLFILIFTVLTAGAAVVINELASRRETDYALFAVRPSGFENYYRLAQMFKARGIDVGDEPVEQGKKIRLKASPR